jgi:predicted dehydrogenase
VTSSSVPGGPLRIGVLGCAGVVDYALLAPARSDGAIEVTAIASRTAERAAEYATRQGIAHSHGSYEALLQDSHIDAVYVALPNSMHHEWTLRSLKAGFPVLCEKPIALNAAQAEEMARCAQALGLTLFDGFHWKHHPLAARMREIVRSGVLGRLRRIDASFTIPSSMVPPENIRRNFALGGGNTMDAGSYCVSLARYVTGTEPEVVSATATVLEPQIDGAMQAELSFPDGIEAGVHCTMIDPGDKLTCRARIAGAAGSLDVLQPFLPNFGARLTWTDGKMTHHEEPTNTPTYVYQARAFAVAVRNQQPGDAWDGVATMRVIDAIYRKAGLDIRH